MTKEQIIIRDKVPANASRALESVIPGKSSRQFVLC
jgi:hypothetical protein